MYMNENMFLWNTQLVPNWPTVCLHSKIPCLAIRQLPREYSVHRWFLWTANDKMRHGSQNWCSPTDDGDSCRENASGHGFYLWLGKIVAIENYNALLILSDCLAFASFMLLTVSEKIVVKWNYCLSRLGKGMAIRRRIHIYLNIYLTRVCTCMVVIMH